MRCTVECSVTQSPLSLPHTQVALLPLHCLTCVGSVCNTVMAASEAMQPPALPSTPIPSTGPLLPFPRLRRSTVIPPSRKPTRPPPPTHTCMPATSMVW